VCPAGRRLGELRPGRRQLRTHLVWLLVAPGHFFADDLTEAATKDAEGLVALRSPGGRRLAVRAAGRSERSRQALADLADALGEVEAATGRPKRRRRAKGGEEG
jgi:hypothetical protein